MDLLTSVFEGQKIKLRFSYLFWLKSHSINANDTRGNESSPKMWRSPFQEQIHDFLKKWELRGLDKYCSSTMISSGRERAAHAV